MQTRAALVLWVLIGALLAGDVVALRAVSGPDYPSRWDPRVAELASFVERERRLDFEHPVEVQFLAIEEYEKSIATDGEIPEEEREAIELYEGQMRALGLIKSDTSIVDDMGAIQSGGTLAYYDDVAEKVVIRGTEITVAMEVTIVHELTHVLQDQAFDIGREFETDGANSFFRALIEGDATRVENAYVEKLDDADQEDYYAESDSEADRAGDELDNIPPALLQLFGAPYALGEQVTTLIVDESGLEKLDTLFRTPPQSDEGLIDVYAAIDGDKPKDVALPKLNAGEKANEDDSGDFGVVAWFIVLSSYVDGKTALVAADGWGGDSYVGYTKGGKSCIKAAFVGDTPNDSVEMANALNVWKTAFTENTATVTVTGDRVELDACEPAAVPAPRADAGDALGYPVARLAILSSILEEGAPRPVAECVANRFITEVPLSALNPTTQAEQQALFNQGQRIGTLCRSAQAA